MATELIHDRGRGPEIVGTRITVYNLLPYFLDPTVTEDYVSRLYDLAPEQIAAARAYILNNADTVLVQHLAIEARIAEGNPPELIERAKRTHADFLRFKDWLAERAHASGEERAVEADQRANEASASRFPSFREWLAAQQSQPTEGT